MKIKSAVLTIIILMIFFLKSAAAFSLRPSQDFIDRLKDGNTVGMHMAAIFVIPSVLIGSGYGLTVKKPISYGIYGGITGFVSGYIFGFILPSIYGYPGFSIVDNKISIFYTRRL